MAMSTHYRWIVGVLAVFACSGDAASPDAATDAEYVDAPVDSAREGCNYIANIGCDFGQKCTFWWTFTGPPEYASVCAPDGDRGLNDTCTIGEDGFDDCEGGLLCHDGTAPGTTCSQICRLGVTECTEGVCVAIDGIFDPNDGVCVE